LSAISVRPARFVDDNGGVSPTFGGAFRTRLSRCAVWGIVVVNTLSARVMVLTGLVSPKATP
jgi:hypothetical protein